ncbi:MAG: sigma-70 family RNA polymerase sigma factor [Pyrinomonadaceae bacterium]|nr:sigma-70 family RNA polymerase sigma factor [Pyrinomonadaceae bacterium]
MCRAVTVNEVDDKSKVVPTTNSPPLHDTTESSDDALVAATLDGDETAFEQLFERHRRFVAHTAGRFFRRREQIEEIIQETFTKVYFALPSYRGAEGRSFPAWLRRIAVNTAYDELRRMQRHPESLVSELTEDETRWLDAQMHESSGVKDAEANVIARDLANKLLDRLDADDRLVLTLLDGEDCSTAEIARITGWSIAKVKVRAHRARKSLRRVLQKFM